MDTRPTSQTDRLRLKAAYKKLVVGCGSGEAAAATTRGCQQTHSDYSNPNHPTKNVPLDVLADLQMVYPSQQLGAPPTLALQAQMAGYVLVDQLDIDTGLVGETMPRLSAKLMVETGDVLTTFGKSIQSGRCRKSTANLIREVREVIDVAHALHAALLQKQEGDL